MKKILTWAVNIFLFAFVIAAPFLMLEVEKLTYKKEYEPNIVLSLWHVDGYEGASNAKNYLEKQTVKFNKTHKNVFIMPKVMSAEELKLNLDNGTKPDIISFGTSVGQTVLPILKSIDSALPVRADLKKAATVRGDLMAMPYCMSSYFLIAKSTDDFDHIFENGSHIKNKKIYSVVTSTKDMPLMNFATEDDLLNKNIVSEVSLLQSDLALSMFKNDNAKILLGKAKDIVNLKNTYSGEFFIKPLENFSDLVQYIGVVNDNYQVEIEEYFEFISSESAQGDLTNYNLFNVINKTFYGSEGFKIIEECTNKLKKTLSPFTPQASLDVINVNLNGFISGNKDVITKIKNYLI